MNDEQLGKLNDLLNRVESEVEELLRRFRECPDERCINEAFKRTRNAKSLLAECRDRLYLVAAPENAYKIDKAHGGTKETVEGMSESMTFVPMEVDGKTAYVLTKHSVQG